MLSNKPVSPDDDPELDNYTPNQPVTVAYNSAMPPEAFDLIIVDEAGRSARAGRDIARLVKEEDVAAVTSSPSQVVPVR